MLQLVVVLRRLLRAMLHQCNGEGGGGRPRLEGGPRELPRSSTDDRPGSHPSLFSPGRGRPRTPPAHGVIHPEHAHKIEFLVDLFHPEFYTFKRMSRKIIRISESSYSLILLQTEQMKRIGNELDSVHFSLKKASQLVKEIGRQVHPPSPSMLVCACAAVSDLWKLLVAGCN